MPFHTLSGVRSSEGKQWFERKFCFSEIRTGDGEARVIGEQLKNTLDGIGEISIRLYRAKVLSATEHHIDYRHNEISKIGSIPEKALKGRAISHQTSLRPSQPIYDVNVVNTEVLDRTPFATFNFRYRSRAALKVLCIIPRSPSPVSLEDKSVDELSIEEMRELLKRQRVCDDYNRQLVHFLDA